MNGRRFHGSTEARTEKEAKAVERRERAKARADLERERITGNGPITLDQACQRFWHEVGQHHRNDTATYQQLTWLAVFFGSTVRLDEITDRHIAEMIAARRQRPRHGRAKDKLGNPTPKVANATVNRTATVVMKAIFMRAKKVWKYPLPLEPNWRDHWLPVSPERVRELDDAEDSALDAAVRSDYGLWFEFVRLTGLRRNETLIRWENVFAKHIATTGKRGRPVRTPITNAIREILNQCREHHSEYVFTFICQQSDASRGMVKGMRYPITSEGAKSQWRRQLRRSGVKNLRFHDLRHDTASKLLRRQKNIKLVQKVLNHADIATTSKYAHVLDEDIVAALEDFALYRKKSRTNGEVDT
ncbi:tyrosine-type recombinase/integrase [Variibacter gotjawalensis]|uniref:tyrosine-type recombinase/integrase n=1 Tax=Variibacter gotjawalensis TaxID=1333996 RepID=UPI003D31C355